MGARTLLLCLALVCVSAKKIQLAARDLPPPGPVDQYSYGFSTAWGYDQSSTVAGPANWGTIWPECNGQRQSPIDLTAATYDATLPPLVFNYPPNTGATEQEFNPSNTIQISLSDSASFTMKTALDTYVLDQVHFHWNNVDVNSGSEHTVNGQSSAMEFHFFHYRSSYSADFYPFVNGDPAGIAVLGVFVDIGAANAELEKFLAPIRAGNLRLDNQVVSFTNNFDLNKLLPSNVANYWAYNGSISVPRCNEVVTWIVLEQHITVSLDQYSVFKTILGNEWGNYTFTHNNRPTQPRNGRVLLQSFPTTTTSPASSNNALAIGVGVGIGVGVPVVAAVIALIAYLACCRRKAQPVQKTVPKNAAAAPSESDVVGSSKSAASKSASSAASSRSGVSSEASSEA